MMPNFLLFRTITNQSSIQRRDNEDVVKYCYIQMIRTAHLNHIALHSNINSSYKPEKLKVKVHQPTTTG
jgi:hypothetical protein